MGCLGVDLKKPLVIALCLITALLTALYLDSWLFLFQEWSNEDFTYCYLVPAIVVYLIWEKRQEFSQQPSKPVWVGLFPVVCGVILYWMGELGGEFTLLFLSLWFVLVGLVWSYNGTARLKTIWFPLVFILAAFTPPDFIYNSLTLQLKIISSQIGTFLLQVYGISAYREGNIIDLGFTQLQVVDACSGLRYLIPLLIMAVLLVYLYKGSWWKKLFIVISTIPLTTIINSARIAMTGILYEVWGPGVAEGFFHGFSGWLIFIVGLALLILEMWALSGFRSFGKMLSSLASLNSSIVLKEREDGVAVPDTKSGSHIKEQAGPLSVPNAPIAPNDARLKGFLGLPQLVVAVIFLGVTLALSQGIEFKEKVPAAKSFSEFPLEVGGWGGKRDVMEQKFIDWLKFSDYVVVDYVDQKGRAVNFYTSFYQSQRKGESVHTPETCLPGAGWEFRNAGSVTLPLASRDGKPMRVNKAVMEKGVSKQLSYFWFPQRDRVLTNAWELKLYNFWDALTRQRTDGALVRLITPLYPGEAVADADRRLAAFTQAIVPVLNEYLPK